MTAYNFSIVTRVQIKAVYDATSFDPDSYIKEADAAQARGAINWQFRDISIGPVLTEYRSWSSDGLVSLVAGIDISSTDIVSADSRREAIEKVEKLNEDEEIRWDYRGTPIGNYIAPSQGTKIWVVESELFATSTTLSISTNPTYIGNPTTLTATVSSTAPVEGNVKFKTDGVVNGTISLSDGSAQIVVTFAGTGNKLIEAVYEGTEILIPSSDSEVLTVNAGP